ncbi:MAG TPA: peptide chain release factor 2 [Phototrophicaceae bacterium]|nr:peptide chain release factor 2 [Phototrophicaceae bacterium]
MENLISLLQQLLDEIATLMLRLDIDGKARRAAELQAQASDPDFWSNPETAQKVMQQIAQLNAEVAEWRGIHTRINDALELAQLEDPDLQEELTTEADALSELVGKMSLKALLSGPYDNSDTILAIHAGAGGTESQDWASMLERMYTRWAQQSGYKIEVLDRSEGEEAGIKSVMMSIHGAYAYGYLQSEAGVHRLVRISPFDAAARRHTSFAKVEVWPDIQDEINIEIAEKDLRIDTYRSSGAGGQNVQKNDTAIRLTHLPTGIVVQVQDQRSQLQNRERAMQVLKSRLFEIERKKREAELSALKGENVDAAWGNQIRSYVLQPYQMVKDHRTGYETGNTGAVLDGRIEEFMEAYLRAKINKLNLTPAPENEP